MDEVTVPTKRMRLNINEDDEFFKELKEHNEAEPSVGEGSTEEVVEHTAIEPLVRRVCLSNKTHIHICLHIPSHQ